MPQAKFSLTKTQIEFINKYKDWGFPNKSALVREALELLKARITRERLEESARLYAEVYAEEKELRDLTEAALNL